MKDHDQFSSISPLDYRYWDPEVALYLSENAFTSYKLKVELALVRVLHRRGLCLEDVPKEIEAACAKITTQEVYHEEERIHHDIRALVNCICNMVSNDARRYVHMTATSYDIINTADAARYKHVLNKVVIPSLIKLENVLIGIALHEADTKQIARTHGQHAVPITFGFAISEYVSRLGNSIEELQALTKKLTGKFSGAVGAYNASSLFFANPENFEAEVLAELGLLPAEHSTQIVPPEALARLLSEITFAAGILANLADDLRNLQRTEIAEVGEEFAAEQVGSSTMPQKQNPINFENVKSLWKIIASRMTMVLMDQISEHQRDLTNSASARTYGEIIAYFVSMVKRMTRAMQKLKVNHANMERNLATQQGLVCAEPLYIILASLGHPDAHEKVRQLTLQARKEGKTLQDISHADPETQTCLDKGATPYQKMILADPSLYTGIAAKKARSVAENWKQKLGL